MAEYLTEPNIPRLSDLEIRQFVLGVADGQVFSTAHMRNNDFEQVGLTVFMPLLGGLAPTHGQQVPMPPPKISPPKPPTHNPHPPKPVPPKFPKKPTLVEVLDQRLEDLAFLVRWDRAPETAIEDYKVEIAAENAEALKTYANILAAHDDEHSSFFDEWYAACAEVDEGNRQLDEKHQDAMVAYQVENAEQLQAFADWEALCEQWRLTLIGQIGVIYEWMEKAGPRSVDGYPTFGSCRLLHKDDWKRAIPAIIREQERRETIEV